MRTKTSAVMAAIVLAATLIAANLCGTALTAAAPVQGDPIPGVDVSIEQSPGGILVNNTETDSHGISKMNANPGEYILMLDPFGSKGFRAKKVQVVNILIKVGPRILFETWDFSRRCLYTKKIEVPLGPPQPIEVTVVEGKACEPTPTPR